MSPPSNKNKDTSHPRHRSHKGCWTCKRKRIQCDETRPSCKRCAERGLTCEGYEIRLRWGAGIASRGRFSGADKPIQESIPPPSKRRWDLRGKAEQRDAKDEQGQPVLLVGQVSSDVRPLSALNQPMGVRATVNILNPPYGQDGNDYIGIIKHFEVPASSSNSTATDQLASAQYGDSTMPGRSAIIA